MCFTKDLLSIDVLDASMKFVANGNWELKYRQI